MDDVCEGCEEGRGKSLKTGGWRREDGGGKREDGDRRRDDLTQRRKDAKVKSGN